jgi:predicted Zn finger-like uncharacterized protein
MSLATRCTECGTVFRVVQDQLKVSDGWVRCGRCRSVFHAQKCLFDLEHDTPPPWQPPAVPSDIAVPADNDVAQAAERSAAAEQRSQPTGALNTPLPPIAAAPAAALPNVDASRSSAAAALDTRLFAPRRADNDSPSDRVADADRIEFADAQFPPGFEPDEVDADADTTDGEEEDASGPFGRAGRNRSPDYVLLRSSTFGDDIDDADLDMVASARAMSRFNATQSAGFELPSAMPSFVAHAQRGERWTRPAMRKALWWMAALAAAVLLAQLALHFRHRIAAQWPDSAPWLQRYCEVAGCRIDALRRIDDVSIESTALTQGALNDLSNGESLRLAVTLRNQGELPIAMPSVDLNLTDANGDLVSRRSLSPADFRVAEPLLKPGIDVPLQLYFSVPGQRVSGYTVEIFYP